MIRTFWNHDKFVRIIYFHADKSSETQYYVRGSLPKELLIHPDHAFNWHGYTTFITADTAVETINPLDFKSQYKPEEFRSAINSKIIAETFSSLKVEKIDLAKILMAACVLMDAVILYMMFKK